MSVTVDRLLLLPTHPRNFASLLLACWASSSCSPSLSSLTPSQPNFLPRFTPQTCLSRRCGSEISRNEVLNKASIVLLIALSGCGCFLFCLLLLALCLLAHARNVHDPLASSYLLCLPKMMMRAAVSAVSRVVPRTIGVRMLSSAQPSVAEVT